MEREAERLFRKGTDVFFSHQPTGESSESPVHARKVKLNSTSDPPRIYVAGPYSTGDPVINTRRAIEAGDQLLEAGLIPFVPHLIHFWHYLLPHEWEEWITYDLHWLRVCDGLVRLAGKSLGADIEVDEAERLCIPVFIGVESCIKHFKEAGG